jgi:hypothetical protein
VQEFDRRARRGRGEEQTVKRCWCRRLTAEHAEDAEKKKALMKWRTCW